MKYRYKLVVTHAGSAAEWQDNHDGDWTIKDAHDLTGGRFVVLMVMVDNKRVVE